MTASIVVAWRSKSTQFFEQKALDGIALNRIFNIQDESFEVEARKYDGTSKQLGKSYFNPSFQNILEDIPEFEEQGISMTNRYHRKFISQEKESSSIGEVSSESSRFQTQDSAMSIVRYG